MIGQNEGDNGIVGLPEGRDEKEGHADEQYALVIEFHVRSLSYLVLDHYIVYHIFKEKSIENVDFTRKHGGPPYLNRLNRGLIYF